MSETEISQVLELHLRSQLYVPSPFKESSLNTNRQVVKEKEKKLSWDGRRSFD